MPHVPIRSLACIALLGLLGSSARAGEAPKTEARTEKRPGIVWYATLDSAKREAKRSGKPILLVSAAPHCHEVSGIW